MTGNSTKKHRFTALKMILILLILNLSAIFFFGQTTAAVDTITVGNDSVSGKGASDGINSGNISAGIDTETETTSKPVDANVIVLPKETDPKKEISDDPKNDDADDPTKGGSSNADASQNGTGGQSITGSTGAANGPDKQNPADTGNLPEIPVSGQSSDANATALMQTELNKIYRHKESKTAYLTFDDGPLPSLTSAVLDILKEEGIKATFFMIGSNAERYPEMVKREYEEGHGIGNHTYSHVFKHIYGSPENYTDELIRSEQVLKSILGEDKVFKLTRFPGGSFGKKLAPYRDAVNEVGYLYVDWNCLNGDAETSKPRSAAKLIERLKETVNGQSSLVVLMHDAPNKQTTVEALPEIIDYLKSEGYQFELLPGSR